MGTGLLHCNTAGSGVEKSVRKSEQNLFAVPFCPNFVRHKI